jgi:solute:Na+ symporter, SSS family
VLLAPGLNPADEAYPTMMRYLPTGLLGLVFAALMAAVVASTASKINSIATIFTLDLYAKARGLETRAEEGHADPEGKLRAEKHLVLIGRVTAAVATLMALVIARPLLGGSDQVFQFIQEFSGFFTPGITVIFLLGLFWKRASEAGAIAAAVTSVALSWLFYFDWAAHAPGLSALGALNAIPFMNRMMWVFLASLAIAVVLSLALPASSGRDRITREGVSFRTSGSFNAAAFAVIAILVALYTTWW